MRVRLLGWGMVWVLALASPALAQDPPPPPPPAETNGDPADAAPADAQSVDLFGFPIPQTRKLSIGGVFVAGYGHDGAQAQLGFEKQGRVGQATITFSGQLTDRVRYFLSFNPVNEVSARPACGEADFFFPNDPRFYTAGPAVSCDHENGHKRVDTYNSYALDYIVQQGPLREGYVEVQATRAFSARLGRFILPIGFAPEEVGSWTAKDMTRIQRLNAEADFGLMLSWAQRRKDGHPLFQTSAMAVLGDGNREKDYDWFYFANPTLDSNSALVTVLTARVTPHRAVDVRAAWKKGFTGSKVERLPSYWASKRENDALLFGAAVQVHPNVRVFGEAVRYVWGPTRTSAQLLELTDEEPIVKPGYYVGVDASWPITDRLRVGATVTREELSRDDSLVKFLALRGLYGVETGKKDRGTVIRGYVDVGRMVTVGLYRADISNPFPWVSGSWPIAGARAFSGASPDKYGLVVLLRTNP